MKGRWGCLDEEKLIRLAQGGDKQAFGRIIEIYYPYVTKFLQKLTGDEQETGDLTQDTFLKLIKSIERFDASGSASFATWVITIAKRTYIDYLRKARHITVDIDSITIPAEISIERQTEQNMLLNEALSEIGRLPKEQALAIRLRHIEHLTLEEIGQKTGCQPKTVKSRIHNGLAKLRKGMNDHG